MDELSTATERFGEAEQALRALADEADRIRTLRLELAERQQSVSEIAATLKSILAAITGPVQSVSDSITAAAGEAAAAARSAKAASNEAMGAATSAATAIDSTMAKAGELIEQRALELERTMARLETMLDSTTSEAVETHRQAQAALAELGERAATQLGDRLAAEAAAISERAAGLESAVQRLEGLASEALLHEVSSQVDRAMSRIDELSASMAPEGPFQTELMARIGHLAATSAPAMPKAHEPDAANDAEARGRMRPFWQWMIYQTSADGLGVPDSSQGEGWRADPWGRYQYRWFDGYRYTDDVYDNGQRLKDPPPPPPGS